jgi:hypothetical protein
MSAPTPSWKQEVKETESAAPAAGPPPAPEGGSES